jgi:APA family basic amino acid/polyamine antiporter
MHPELPRPFKTPFIPWTPLLAIAFSVYLMVNLPPVTWIRLAVWLGLGLILYLTYGHRHSKLRTRTENTTAHPLIPEPVSKPLPSEAKKPKNPS